MAAWSALIHCGIKRNLQANSKITMEEGLPVVALLERIVEIEKEGTVFRCE